MAVEDEQRSSAHGARRRMSWAWRQAMADKVDDDGDDCVLFLACETRREAEIIGAAVTWAALAMHAHEVAWRAERNGDVWELSVDIKASHKPERFEGGDVADLIEYGSLE